MAYNIKIDEEARQRCVLVAFLKRVYDDLVDKQGISKDLLFTGEPSGELSFNPDYRLFMELRGLIRRLAPRDKFPQYYRLLPQVSAAQNSPAPYKIKNGFLLDMYIMKDDLPEEVIRAMDITAEFFAYLDDFYDYDEDLSQGKSTPVNRSAQPRATLEKKFADTCVYLQANSPNPGAYLGGLGNLMRNVLFLRENKLNKLSLFI